MAAPSTISGVISPLAGGAARTRMALAVADANWFTTENLFSELDRPGVDTLLLNCLDYYNAWRQGNPPWRARKGLAREGADSGDAGMSSLPAG